MSGEVMSQPRPQSWGQPHKDERSLQQRDNTRKALRGGGDFLESREGQGQDGMLPGVLGSPCGQKVMDLLHAALTAQLKGRVKKSINLLSARNISQHLPCMS